MNGVISELEYGIDSQLITNSFVNEDYFVMSNMRVGMYLGASREGSNEALFEHY